MIYNFNLGIGWASSGVEYAQLYRARIFRSIKREAKFIFTDMFLRDNLEHLTKNIGLLDEEVIWLYSYFTDVKTAPVSFTLADLEKTIGNEKYTFSRDGLIAKYVFEDAGSFYTVYMVDEKSDLVHRVEIVSKGCLIRKDYYTYCKVFSEYYAPLDNSAHLYGRRFFNEDGSLAFEEINDNDNVMYKFPDRVLGSKEELVAYMVQSLHLTEHDIVIIDRTSDIGQPILQNVKPAKVGIIVHADHFSEGSAPDGYMLWNNYYEYPFAQVDNIDFYVTATDAQNDLMMEQFEKYSRSLPCIYTIPVGSLASLKYPSESGRKPFSLVTASRLASEKHVDWVIKAVVKAREALPELSLDIYGKGGLEDDLRELIEKNDATSYIRLMGQQNLDEVYQKYEMYVAGSTSEGFGLSLLEAVGGGLPIVGFDVRYGNQTFIDNGKNGFLIPINEEMDESEKVNLLSESIIKVYKELDIEECHRHSYDVAAKFLTKEVEGKWENLIEQMI